MLRTICWNKLCDHYRIKCNICLLVFGVFRCRFRRRHVCVYIFRCPCCHGSFKALAASDMRVQKQGAAPLATRGGASGPRSHTVVLFSSNAAVFYFERCDAAASSTARVHHNGGAQTCTICSSSPCALPCGGTHNHRPPPRTTTQRRRPAATKVVQHMSSKASSYWLRAIRAVKRKGQPPCHQEEACVYFFRCPRCLESQEHPPVNKGEARADYDHLALRSAAATGY